jgi:hypothetical protein
MSSANARGTVNKIINGSLKLSNCAEELDRSIQEQEMQIKDSMNFPKIF